MAERVLITCVVVFAVCACIAKAFPEVPHPPKWWHYAVVTIFISASVIGVADILYLVWR